MNHILDDMIRREAQLQRFASFLVREYVNPKTAEWSHKGLSTVQLQEGSTFQEDQRNQYQHITTAIGYFVHRLWPVDRGTIAAPQFRMFG